MKTCKRKPEYPDWAKYRAVDKYGAVCVYENKPHPRISVWDYDGTDKRWRYVKTKKNPPKDWTKTLRRIED